mgnify:CR=1 FL=1
MNGRNFRELIVWQKAMTATEEIYKMVKLLPKDEMFSLSDQMKRAAVSIPSNIAEGNARGSSKEMIRFLYIAQGSCAELETQLELCYRFGYINEEILNRNLEKLKEVGCMLAGLIKSKSSNL